MLRSVASKVMWVGKAATFCVGLTVILALVLGAATTALAGTGVGAVFNLGKVNSVDRLSVLVGGASGAMLRVDNDGPGTALELRVGSATAEPATKGIPPMKVDSGAKVANLNADKVDGRSFGCPGGTLFHEGACIEVAKRQENGHGFAHQDCTDEGRRLPSVEELLTFRNRSGHDFAGADSEWTSEVEYNGTSIGANWVSPSGAVGWGSAGGSGIRDYRCVASPS
jgi:hypothetical protein